MLRELQPVYEISVHFSCFHNVDLYQRGYYQVRSRVRPPSKAADSKVSIRIPRTKASHLFPATVVEGQAVGETIEILYAEERVELDDLVIFTVKLLTRADKLPKWLDFKLVVELWFVEKERIVEKRGEDVLCAFRCVSRRELSVRVNHARGIHYHRPVFFDYFHLAAVTITLRGSLISLEPKFSSSPSNNKLETLSSSNKSKVDSGDKLRTYHETICRLLLSAYEALQLHIHAYSSLMPLNMQLRIQLVDTKMKLDALCKRLEGEEDGWRIIEEDRQLLSQELTVLWKQLCDLFHAQKTVDFQLGNEFHVERVKRLAECFFYEEDSCVGLITSLTTPSVQSMRLYNRVSEALKKSAYLVTLPDLSVSSAELDGSPPTFPIIFEQKYSPSNKPHSPSAKLAENAVSPRKVSLKMKSSFCLDLNHCNTPAESSDKNGTSKNGRNKKVDARRRSSSAGRLIDKLLSKFDSSPTPPETKFYSLTDDSQPKVDSTSSACSGVAVVTTNSQSEPNLCVDRLLSLQEILMEPFELAAAPKSHSDDNLILRFRSKPSQTHECVDKLANNGVKSPCKTSAFCCLPLCQDNVLGDVVGGESPPRPRVRSALGAIIDPSVVEFVQNKELFKNKMALLGYEGHLCSDFISHASRIPILSGVTPRPAEEGRVHLVICVHGLDGCSSDLRPYKTFLRMGLPDQNLDFLMSQSNESCTFSDVSNMSQNLVDEILMYLSQCLITPHKISFIGHSLGVLVIRAALGDPRLVLLHRKLHCFLSLNGPHCGVMFSPGAVNLGMSFVQWWKKSASLQQLSLSDQPPANYENAFLYKLCHNQSLALFRYVLLVGSHQDMYVPCHSALIQPSPASSRDSGPMGRAYEHMVHTLVNSVASSPRGTVLVRYTVIHGLAGVSRTHKVLGRAAHIAVLDDDVFIDKLLSVSAYNYFR